MRTLYNLGIHILNLLMQIVALFNPKAKKWVRGRKGIFNRIANEIEPGYIIWIHSASVGEFEQASPLIERIRKDYPNKKILLTFYSPSGYELYKNYELANYVYYLPIDTKRNARRFIQLIQPELVFFIKYEFWFNYIKELYKRIIPIHLVSTIFRPSQHFFKWYGGWSRKHLRMIEHFYVQDIESASLLNGIGINGNRISLTGDTRFDRVKAVSLTPDSYDTIRDYIDGSQIMLAGSTWKPDETLLAEFLKHETRDFKLIIAPHEVNTAHLDDILSQYSEYSPMLFSEFESRLIPKENKVLIIDSVGKLKHLYQYCDVAYIGGGFGVGIHNILEAATYKKPVIFGPKYQKFKEAKDLVQLKGAFTIRNSEEFNSMASKLLFDHTFYNKTSIQCGDYVEDNLGATEKIFEEAFEIN